MTEYTLTRSRRKTVCIVVHRDASVEVRAPLKMKQADIESFVKAKESWINEAVARLTPVPDISYGKVFPYLGGSYILTESSCKTANISGKNLLLPVGTDIKNAINTFLKAQAKAYIPQRVEALSQQFEQKPASVQINSAKTHWGSCTKDRLHFSCYLMLADKETVEYVIIHELAHIRHPNHSKLFWAEVAKHCPDYINLKNRLKTISGYVEKLQNK